MSNNYSEKFVASFIIVILIVVALYILRPDILPNIGNKLHLQKVLFGSPINQYPLTVNSPRIEPLDLHGTLGSIKPVPEEVYRAIEK